MAPASMGHVLLNRHGDEPASGYDSRRSEATLGSGVRADGGRDDEGARRAVASAHIGFYPRVFGTDLLAEELRVHPELWNQYTGRLSHPMSPHRHTDDIWLRFAEANLGKPDERVMGPHKSVWFPASETLSAGKELAEEMYRYVDGKELGGVLIIRVPPGKAIYKHVDAGWHAAYYNKIAVQISGDPEQEFAFEDGSLSALDGESYWLNNSHPHWVTNPTDKPWINMTVCYRN